MASCGLAAGLRVLLLAALWWVVAVAAAAAQEPAARDMGGGSEDGGFLAGFTGHGEVEAGGSVPSTTSDSSKFEEYRDIPENAVLPAARLHLDNERYNYFVDLYAEDAFERDQRYTVRFGEAGHYEVELGWDQIPHRFSNSGRTLATKTGEGLAAISDEIQRDLQADPSRLAGFLAAARSLGLGLRQDTGRFRFRYTPTPRSELHAGYALERQRGSRPIGTASFFSAGADVVELPEPMDYLTHTVDLGAGYGRGGWRLEVGYLGSFFVNGIERLEWDNPLRASDVTGGFRRGRLALPPDNQAHAVTVRGAAALPLRSRAVGTVRYGWMLQSSDFLPFTSNRALRGMLPLPARSLGGEVGTFLVDTRLDSRALDPVTFGMRYRLYDLDDRSRGLVFPDYVQADTQRAGIARRNLLYSFSRQEGSVRLRWLPARAASLRLEYGWERWHRERREATRTDEHRIEPAVDLNPWGWLLLRATYQHAIRSVSSGYNVRAPEASFPGGDPVGRPRLRLLRKFDEAHRQRDQVDLLAEVSPVERVSLTGALALGADDFDRSRFGLLDDDHLSYSLDLTWRPHSRLSVSGGYTREEHRYSQASRFRAVTLVGGRMRAVDDPATDWRSRGDDTIDTLGTHLQVTLVPGRATADLSYDVSAAVGRLRGRAARGGDPAGEAVDFPNVRNRLHQLVLQVECRIRGGLWARLGYAFERYEEDDFAQDRMQPFMGGVDPGARESVFLGARAPGYNAHIGTFTLAYRF